MNTSAFAKHSQAFCLEHREKRRAVTLIELIVVVLIIGLLATIATPVYTLKMEQAKIATAQQECKEFAMAEEACAAAHGFYVPLQVLNDIGTTNTLSTSYVNLTYQYVAREVDSTYGGNATNFYLIFAGRELPTVTNILAEQPDLVKWSSSGNTYRYYPELNRLVTQWAGPFINFQRYAFKDDIKNGTLTNPQEYLMNDFPLDPWGNPYRLYSPYGLVGTNSRYLRWSDIESNRRTFSDGLLTQDDPRFDRFAVVSYGPDALTGDAAVATNGYISTGSVYYNTPLATNELYGTDDIYYLFGGNISANSYKTILY
ncbi:TPA: hypothetical protein DDW35_01695 [Candidatus Sumerlaeota bacterium]|nr:hypothetical protein [Candidatus Sumerlaeota bacterium]